MRNIYKILTLSLATVALSACGNDWLDTKPTTSVPSDEALTTYRKAAVALTGVYDGLQGSSSRRTYYAARMFYYGDVRGDDMQARDQGMRSSSCYEMKYNSDDAPVMWGIPYNVIRRANKLIEAVDTDIIVDATEKQLNEFKAEALTVRALVYFDLCRIYAKPYTMDNGASLGVPLVLVPTGEDSFPARSTVDEVYTQIIKDLTDALNLEGGLTDKSYYGYVNTWFAKGLLSRVYLYKGDYESSLKYAEEVIKDSSYKLWTNKEYVGGWVTSDKGRKEMIFEIVNHSSDDWADREGIAYLMNENGYADLIATKSFLDELASDPKDVRNGIVVAAEDDDSLIEKYGDAKIFVNKFPADASSGEMRLNSLPILRLSEVYLNAAESAAQLSKGDLASKYLNAIVTRANPDAAEVSPTDATVERILLERRKEFVGEGHRFFDAMRTNTRITRYTNEADMGFHYTLTEEASKSFDRTYFRTILPIPFDEIKVNANIEKQQNEGY